MVQLIRKLAKRAIIGAPKTRPFARLAQIPFGFAQGRLSLRKERLFKMTSIHHSMGVARSASKIPRN
jgi:hypothetical protein